MKKIFPYILILTIIVQLFAPFTVGSGVKNNLGVGVNKAEAADCKIENVTIDPLTTNQPRPDLINVSIETSGCIGKPGMIFSHEIQVKHTFPSANDIVLNGTVPGPFLTDNPSFSFHPGEAYCKKGTCEIYYSFKLIENGKIIDEYTNGDTGFSCKSSSGCSNAVEWTWATESVTPTTTFWFFEVTYADGTKYKYSPFPGETGKTDCEAKRGIVSGSVSEETVVGECQQKSNDQIVDVSVYYFEKIKDGEVIGESDDYPGETGKTDCEVAKALFDESVGDSGITTSSCKQKTIEQAAGGLERSGDVPTDSGFPACSIWHLGSTLGGCIGIGLYYLFFKPTSLIFSLSGRILDFTLMYSISDTSYRSEFVVNGWGIIRDFCNMFFIFVLLYIAFGTILNLHGVKTKEMIINVVIIGLLINFSLFTTQVIIDTSNILTRVFYNQNTIKTGTAQKDENGNVINDSNGKPVVNSELGDFGEIKLSESIVNKVDPQQLIIQSKKVGEIPQKGLLNSEAKNKVDEPISAGSFIIVVFLATIVNVVGTIAFISSAFIFIGRVVMLWLAMILAPLAFFSYVVPQLQDIKMIGWKHWWPETLKMAFVAPVFAFFMYIIVGFLDKGLGIVNASMKDASTLSGSLSFLIAIIVPFIFIMVLLMKAKSVAVDMSGEIGSALSKAGAAVGGAGLAVATGGAAMAMRGTLGAYGSKIGNSEKLANMEAKGGAKGWMAGRLRNLGTSTGKASFDVRATKLGARAGKGMEVDMGKAKEGGYDKYKDEKNKTRLERADKIKDITTKAKQKDVAAAQIDLKETMLARKPELDAIDKDIAKTRQAMKDAKDGDDPARAKVQLAILEDLQKERDIIRGTTKDVTYDKLLKKAILGPDDTKDSNGNIIKSIDEAEKAERDALHSVSKAENTTLNQFANSLNSRTSRVVNLITSLGQDRRSAIEKTSMEIRKGTKAEKDKGDVGH